MFQALRLRGGDLIPKNQDHQCAAEEGRRDENTHSENQLADSFFRATA